jgi:2-polyprenyl-3-methyl-5-hydroxy-6-metoxy-1,4-benzoquinol methylase
MSDQGAGGLLSPFLKAQRLKKASKYAKGRTLDFGCGVGDLVEYCKPGSYLGIDIDLQSLLIAQNKYPHLNFANHFPLNNGSDEVFDTIIISAVIEHLSDPTALLKLLNKHLDRNGCIVITTPHPSMEWVLRLGARVGFFSAEANKEHKTLLDKKMITRMALDANLIFVYYERFLLGANQLIVLKRRN